MVLEQGGAVDPRRVGGVMVGRAAGSGEVNVGGADPREREQQRREQRSGDEKNVLSGEEVADNAEDGCSREAADRGEARIAPEPFGERVVADEPKADGGDARTEQAPGRALHEDGQRQPRAKSGQVSRRSFTDQGDEANCAQVRIVQLLMTRVSKKYSPFSLGQLICPSGSLTSTVWPWWIATWCGPT